MTDQGASFRFDIYERVLIPDDTPAVVSLEQVELKPEVRAIPGREQSQLQGCLELTAVYETEQAELGQQTFVHRIPVEISLPTRGDSAQIGQIQVQIEQFDVELLSKRSLNVTGVLSLSGWEEARAEEREDGEEELVAVHEAERAAADRTEAEAARSPEQQGEAAAAPAGARSEDELQEMLEAEEKGLYPEVPAFIEDETDIAEEDLAQEEEAGGTEEEPEPEKQELKLAFKPAKTESDPFSEESGFGREEQPKANNALQWKSLFLSRDEETKFRRMRICIVQKEETIQSIAERYQLHPREIELYNKLGENGLSEGQILYIPTR